jgi:predicted Holliday junction resolvase-like endonuclease
MIKEKLILISIAFFTVILFVLYFFIKIKIKQAQQIKVVKRNVERKEKNLKVNKDFNKKTEQINASSKKVTNENKNEILNSIIKRNNNKL